jgi:hypothetical protein
MPRATNSPPKDYGTPAKIRIFDPHVQISRLLSSDESDMAIQATEQR